MPVYDKLEKFAQRACGLIDGALVAAPSPKGRKFVCYSNKGMLDISLSETVDHILVNVTFVTREGDVAGASLTLGKTADIDVKEEPGEVVLRHAEGTLRISPRNVYVFNVSTSPQGTMYTDSLITFRQE